MKNIKNESLTPISRTLRKNMTREERHLWYDFLKSQPEVFKRQKVIGNYIVDFFCAQAGLVIELDGSQHYSPEGKERDAERDEYLKSKGLTVLRYSNLEVEQNFQGVCTEILKHLVVWPRAFPRTGEGGASAPDEGVPSNQIILFRRYGLMKRGLKGFAFLVSGLVLGIIGATVSATAIALSAVGMAKVRRANKN